MSSFPPPGPGDPVPGRTGSARTGIARAALVCSAAVAAVLTAQLAVLIIMYLTFDTPPNVEGPLAFIALMMLLTTGIWIGIEAVASWLAFANVVRRFPRGSAAMIGVQGAITFLHSLLTISTLSFATWPYEVALGAVVPLSIATVILFSRAADLSAQAKPR